MFISAIVTMSLTVLNGMKEMKRVLLLGVGFQDKFEKILSQKLDY
jgi:hypothetical protein